MKWFKHQSDARNSLKLRKIRRKYGADGYAIYWFCLEAIAYEVDKDNLTFDLKEDAETIAFELSIQEKRVEEIMLYMVETGLFERSQGVITCLKLAESIDKSMTNSPLMRKWLDTKSVMTSTDTVMTSDDTVNTCTELEVEVEVEVEKNIKTICDSRFEEFWNMYDHKKSKAKCEPKFNSLNESDINKIFEVLPNYIKSTPDKKYRKNPETWINQKCWNDEIAEVKDYSFVVTAFTEVFRDLANIPMSESLTDRMISDYELLVSKTNLTDDKIGNYFKAASKCFEIKWARDGIKYAPKGIEFYLSHDTYDKVRRVS